MSFMKLFAAGMVFLFSQQALAVDLGKVDGIADMVNKAAKSRKSNIRMIQRRCEVQKLQICQYGLTGDIGALASSPDSATNEADFISFVFARGSDATVWIELMLLAIQIWSPNADSAERKTAFLILSDDIRENKKNEIRLHGISYILTAPPGLGMFLNIAKAN